MVNEDDHCEHFMAWCLFAFCTHTTGVQTVKPVVTLHLWK